MKRKLSRLTPDDGQDLNLNEEVREGPADAEEASNWWQDLFSRCLKPEQIAGLTDMFSGGGIGMTTEYSGAGFFENMMAQLMDSLGVPRPTSLHASDIDKTCRKVLIASHEGLAPCSPACVFGDFTKRFPDRDIKQLNRIQERLAKPCSNDRESKDAVGFQIVKLCETVLINSDSFMSVPRLC